MALTFSSKFKQDMLTALKTALGSDYVIYIYSGTRPISANLKRGTSGTGDDLNTLLGIVKKSDNSNLVFEVANEGSSDEPTLRKLSSDTWQFTGSAGISATKATWFRIAKNDDDSLLNGNKLDYVTLRIDGAIGSDMTIDSSTIEAGKTYIINSFSLTWG